MKRLLCFAILTVLSLAAQAADTAYTALRVVGKKGGDPSLTRVLEVHGRFGAPEPQIWKVVLADPAARGGVREFEVQRGKITGERAPSGRGDGGAPLDLNKLNIDSEGAFTILNQEAQKTGLAFDRVDYVLSNAGRNGAPLWHLDVFNGANGKVASMDISADTGSVVSRDFQGGSRPAPPQDDRAFLREQNDRARRGDPDDRRAYEEDRGRPYDERRQYRDNGDEDLGPGITDIFGKIGRHFEKRSDQLKHFFGR